MKEEKTVEQVKTKAGKSRVGVEPFVVWHFLLNSICESIKYLNMFKKCFAHIDWYEIITFSTTQTILVYAKKMRTFWTDVIMCFQVLANSQIRPEFRITKVNRSYSFRMSP